MGTRNRWPGARPATCSVTELSNGRGARNVVVDTADEVIEYTITVDNNGTVDLTGVVLGGDEPGVDDDAPLDDFIVVIPLPEVGPANLGRVTGSQKRGWGCWPGGAWKA